ncbi:sulfite exporter TauE/SafE family protein [Opitutaceae bacterium TAV4]|nr:sulfite exporter TauE/SafE family protein [Opitutaceae bacterium TAV4]RRJ99949.1 sulfite exporter TauE/SafE family protein [Opitutaceae bacterium TAV3]
MSLEPWQWLLAVVAAFLVGVSKTGIAGLGMLFVSVFAMIMPAKQASGFVLPLLIFGDLVAVAAYRRHAQWSHLWRLFPWTGAGVIIGWLAMDLINDRQARIMVGLIVLVLLALHFLRRWQTRRHAQTSAASTAQHGPWFAPTVGVLAGFTTLVSNAAGPLMAIYLIAMRLPKMQFVGTSAVFFLLLNCFKVPFMTHLGLITPQSITFNFLLAPAVLGGALIGRWILPRINQTLFEFLALGLSGLAALKLLGLF